MSDGRRTELIEGVDGPRLLKVASTEEGRHLITQEVARLAAAHHPGVVELLDHDDERIEIAWAGDRTLELATFDIDGAAALLAAVASTIADLHDLGVIHGRIDLAHVIVAPDGGPRLCGMSGPRSGEPAPAAADDVAALGRLMHHLVGDGVAAEPIPERRWRRRRWSGYQQRALQNLADQAQADDVERRPSARTLATSIAEVVPGARLARPTVDSPGHNEPLDSTEPVEPLEGCQPAEPSEPSSPGESAAHAEPPQPAHEREPKVEEPIAVATERRPPRMRLLAGIGAATATLMVLVVVGNHRSGPPPSDAAPARTTETADPTAPQPSPGPEGADRSVPSPTPAVHASTTTPRHCTPVVGLAADVDDDGCPDPVVIEGTTITAGSIVFRAGDPDDHVMVGDWRCTGRVAPGLVRPATGEVFLFDRWPDDDAPLEADPVAIVPGGARLVARADSCGAPSVASTDGEMTHLDLTGDAG